jgi:hypothetical protein
VAGERERGRGGRNCPTGQPYPPLYTQSPCRPDNLANLSLDYPPPPGYSAQGADILAWNAREQIIPNFDKTELLFDENLISCA